MSLNEEDMERMKQWGFNIVRLGIIWEAVETAPGVYNHTYLSEVEELVNRLSEKGIYSIIDTHQDLFSRMLCGEGVPLFYNPSWEELDHECPSFQLVGAIFKLFHQCDSFSTYNIPLDADGLPDIKECAKRDFIALFTSPEVASAWGYFWENTNGIQDKFANYWRVVAAKFMDNTNVLGYDLLNEPWNGNMYQDSSLAYNT